MAEWPPHGPLVIELYVLGRAPSSETALANLRRICERHLSAPGAVSLQIIDVLENPQAAEDARVTATPTLLKRAPRPLAYVVGDLSATATVLRALGIDTDDDRSEDRSKDRDDERKQQ